jgi:D-arabinose 1-dehydrogenase-like Zn-dependent alcohol dehydrogenase
VPKPLSIPALYLIFGNIKVGGSNIGSPALIRKMLEFATDHGIGTRESPSPYIQKYNMDDINKALPDFIAGNPRYRFVLVNTENGGRL